MRIRHTVAAVLAVALTTAGCGSSDSGGDDPVEATSSSATAPSTTATATTTEATAAATSATCGDDLLARLTLRQKLAQLLNV